MSGARRMSVSLDLREENGQYRVCCKQCGHALGPAGAPWKQSAILLETPLKQTPGTTYATAHGILFRRFCCPGCAALLDTETALPGAPFLNDVVEVTT